MGDLPLLVFGAGGHGKVVADILIACGLPVAGFLDDARSPGAVVAGLTVIGGSAWLAANRAQVALGLGDNRVRARIAEACESSGSTLLTAVHPRAVVSRSARIEKGAVVMALAVVNPDAVVERGAIVNTAAIIEHDCVVGAFAHVSPNAAMAGGCRLGPFAHLGIGASMLPGATVGDGTIIGGGALVTKDFGNDAVAVGVPARVI